MEIMFLMKGQQVTPKGQIFFVENHDIQHIQPPSVETHTSPSDGVSCTLTQSSAAARCSSSCLSITEWQHTSETEDNQSIISHHCAMMILLVDTEDISLLKPLSEKLFFCFSEWFEDKKKALCSKKYSPRVPNMFSEMIIFRGIIDHAAQQYNLFYLTSLSALQFICRGTILVGKNEIAMWLTIKVRLL